MGHGDSSFELVLERDGTLRLLSGVGDQEWALTPCIARSSPSCWASIPTRSRIEVGNTVNAPYDQGIKARAEPISKDRPWLRTANSLIAALCEAAAARCGTTAAEKITWERGGALFREQR